ncbi:hypothetical protein S7711_10215 [Stachybotrys chartarum IBT 7711]|uniref:Calcineurin-like phosphoesterase domain-containing protein n=1 Tax=Stachybotrys chartarum (strain CBS 109288 / IBT 7711) TaxID=1280523 RepID=A0A084AF26_STACB|nr:hypothetical protein S7711_10215 [Stachybotrys chartarum IBT 7711]KFA70973.1 hypothetical protein S40288_10327 [Stachybotrys chartarum IBT 40288]
MADRFVPQSDRLRIVCVSDTHNDNCTKSIPDADIVIHSGDMTDYGTIEELRDAYRWIAALPHKVKIVIAGNHDIGLDKEHKLYLPEAVELFTSESAQAAGIHYIDRQSKVIPLDTNYSRTLSVYGNPAQPDFLKSSYAFTYLPHPSPEASDAWKTAPVVGTAASIWVTHGGPLGHLDWIPIPSLRGCEIQAQAVAKARPVLAVFGHFHISHGVELVTWKQEGEGEEKTEVLVKDGSPCLLDFMQEDRRFRKGEKTIFVNAAWMTLDKTQTENRYQPVVLDLPASVLS